MPQLPLPTSDMMSWTLEEVAAVFELLASRFGSEEKAEDFLMQILLDRCKEDILRN